MTKERQDLMEGAAEAQAVAFRLRAALGDLYDALLSGHQDRVEKAMEKAKLALGRESGA